MKSPFKFGRDEKPFLSPLQAKSKMPRLSRETFEQLPSAAAPIAVTVIGGLALVLLLGWFLSREAGVQTAASDTATLAGAATPAPAEVPVSDEQVASASAPSEADVPAALDTPPAPPPVSAAAPSPSDTRLFNDAPLAGTPRFDTGTHAADTDATASIPPASPGVTSFAPNVPVAESDDEVAALEAVQREEVDEDVGLPSGEETAAIPAPTGPMAAATTTQWVNMRRGPADDAEIMIVVPALADIQAQTECNWCSVSYDGQQGYIYRTFIDYADSAAAQ